MRAIAALALPALFAVTACSIPTPLTIVTIAFDGISLAVSGKTIGDHALSAIANEDCAMWRALKERPICHKWIIPDAVPETVVAAAPAVDTPSPAAQELDQAEITIAETAPESEYTSMGTGNISPVTSNISPVTATVTATAQIIAKDTYSEMVSASRPQREAVALAANEAANDAANEAANDANDAIETAPKMPAPKIMATPAEATPMEIASIAAISPAAAPPVEIASIAAIPPATARPEARYFIVLGSYLQEANATDAMARGRDFAPRMVRVRVRGRVFHRVVSGPFARDAISTMRKTLTGEGFPNNWTAKLCMNSLRRGPCHAMPVNVATRAPAS